MMKQVLVLMLGLLSTTAGQVICNGMICPSSKTTCTGESTDINGVQTSIDRCLDSRGRIEKERAIINGGTSVFLGSITCTMLREMVNGRMATTKGCYDKNCNEKQMTQEQEAIFREYLYFSGWTEEEEVELDDRNDPRSKEEKKRFDLKDTMNDLDNLLDDFMDDKNNRWSEEQKIRLEKKIDDLKHTMDDLDDYLDDLMDNRQ